jgi:RNA polymerase sigma factor (sigma-70 family)
MNFALRIAATHHDAPVAEMTHSLSDDEIMSQVRGGNPELLGLLFERYEAPLFSFFRRLTGDRGLSEDLVQEVFLRVLKYARTYRPGSSFRSWIYEIARNARLNSARPRRETEFDENLPEFAVAQTDHVENEQRVELLERALRKMNADEREVLVLSRFHGLKYAEIAGLLGCSEGAVKVRVFRALETLRLRFREAACGGQGGRT